MLLYLHFLGYEWSVWYCGERWMSTCYSPFTNTTDGVCRFELTGHQDMFKTYGLDDAQLHWDFFFVDLKNRYIIIYIHMYFHSLLLHLIISAPVAFCLIPLRLSVISGTLPMWAVTLPKVCPFLFSWGGPKTETAGSDDRMKRTHEKIDSDRTEGFRKTDAVCDTMWFKIAMNEDVSRIKLPTPPVMAFTSQEIFWSLLEGVWSYEDQTWDLKAMCP